MRTGYVWRSEQVMKYDPRKADGEVSHKCPQLQVVPFPTLHESKTVLRFSIFLNLALLVEHQWFVCRHIVPVKQHFTRCFLGVSDENYKAFLALAEQCFWTTWPFALLQIIYLGNRPFYHHTIQSLLRKVECLSIWRASRWHWGGHIYHRENSLFNWAHSESVYRQHTLLFNG